jgi:hypothetical protein
VILEDVYQDEWDNLSGDCQKGLRAKFGSVASITAMLMAVNRAVADMATLTDVGEAHGVDPALLAAIGIRESAFQVRDQPPPGKGVGVFQIDLGQNPSVTHDNASDTAWAANWAAIYLAANASQLAQNYLGLDATTFAQALASSYNHGLGQVSKNLNNGVSVDLNSKGVDNGYGKNVVQLTDCFR